MRNLYGRLPDLRFACNAQGVDAVDADLLRALEQASAFARTYTGRIFHSEVGTAEFNGNGRTELWLRHGANQPYRGDLISVTTLKTDENGDGVFELTLVEDTDYWLHPDNPTATYRPAERIDIVMGRTATRQINGWRKASRNIQIAGLWGYSQRTQASGLTGTLADASDTTITTAEGQDTEGLIYPGDVLLIESEQVYVSAVSTTTVTVERGVNGTTAAAHSAQALLIRRYDEDLERAVVADAARWVWHAASGYPSEASGFGERWPAIRDALAAYRVPVMR